MKAVNRSTEPGMSSTPRRIAIVALTMALCMSLATAAWAAPTAEVGAGPAELPTVQINIAHTEEGSDPALPERFRVADIKVLPGTVEVVDGAAAATTTWGYTFGYTAYDGYGWVLFTVYERIEWSGTSISLNYPWGDSGLATWRPPAGHWEGASGGFGANWAFSVGPWGWPQYDPWTDGTVYSNGHLTITIHS